MKIALKTSIYRVFLTGLALLGAAIPLQASAAPPTKPSCASALVHAVQQDRDMRGYFLMTRLFKHGRFAEVAEEMPKFKEAGINTLWISPPHPQTIRTGFDGQINNHGYWPAGHHLLDAEQGGATGFKEMLVAAEKNGVHIAVDAVLNHFGPNTSGKYRIGKKIVSADDTHFFKPQNPNGLFTQPREAELHALLETESDPVKFRALQKELTEYSLWRLPSLRHEVPEVSDYLLKSYGKFVDYGVDTFRIDAPKYISTEFLQKFVHTLATRGAEKGKQVKFIFEFLVEKSTPLDLYAKDFLGGSRFANQVYFFDFPLAKELRRLNDPNYRMDWLNGFLRYRIENRHPVKNYIPMIENHDFEDPLHMMAGHKPFQSKLIYALGEFVSENPTIIHHGSEQFGRATSKRAAISSIDPAGDKLALRNTLSDTLADYRAAGVPNEMITHVADKDVLILERRLSPKRSVVMVANKGNSPAKHTIKLPRVTSAEKVLIRESASEGTVSLERVSQADAEEFTLGIEGESFKIFEVRKR